MPKSKNHRADKNRKKKYNQRKSAAGRLRIPPPAIAYFFNANKQLKIVFPITGEHPDVTIKRLVHRSGIVPSPASVKVTKRYFDMVRNLPSSSVELPDSSKKTSDDVSIFDADTTVKDVQN